MNTSDFIKGLRKEIHALKKNLTNSEKSKLDIETFNGGHSDHCIYGQATGSAYSKRANKLKDICRQDGETCEHLHTQLEKFVINMNDGPTRDGKMIIKFIKGDIKELRKIS